MRTRDSNRKGAWVSWGDEIHRNCGENRGRADGEGDRERAPHIREREADGSSPPPAWRTAVRGGRWLAQLIARSRLRVSGEIPSTPPSYWKLETVRRRGPPRVASLRDQGSRCIERATGKAARNRVKRGAVCIHVVHSRGVGAYLPVVTGPGTSATGRGSWCVCAWCATTAPTVRACVRVWREMGWAANEIVDLWLWETWPRFRDSHGPTQYPFAPVTLYRVGPDQYKHTSDQERIEKRKFNQRLQTVTNFSWLIYDCMNLIIHEL